jgi:hypothetical protein
LGVNTSSINRASARMDQLPTKYVMHRKNQRPGSSSRFNQIPHADSAEFQKIRAKFSDEIFKIYRGLFFPWIWRYNGKNLDPNYFGLFSKG